MVELLRYLEAHGFSCYIVSGGDRDFMRPITAEYYGIPPERVVGSAVGLSYDADSAEVRYGSAFDFMDDGPMKPVRIWTRIGRRPILAAGNSNGDIEMLRYTQGSQDSLALLIHHDDDSGRGDAPYDAGAELALAAAAEHGFHGRQRARRLVDACSCRRPRAPRDGVSPHCDIGISAAARRDETADWFAPTLHGYRREWIGPDVLAGLAAGAVVVPQGMAYATIASLPVQIGLYSCMVPMLVYALLGGSRAMSVSTTSTIATLTATTLVSAGVAAGSDDAVRDLTTLTLLVGVILLLARLLRLGAIVENINKSTHPRHPDRGGRDRRRRAAADAARR